MQKSYRQNKNYELLYELNKVSSYSHENVGFLIIFQVDKEWIYGAI